MSAVRSPLSRASRRAGRKARASAGAVSRVKCSAPRTFLRLLLLVVGVLVVANIAIALAVPVARLSVDGSSPAQLEGIGHLRAVDDKVWRGDSPNRAGYAGLADAGVTTVVDLRAEKDLRPPLDLLRELGLRRVALPVRDGQTPTRAQVHAFQEVVAQSRGLVYVHCGAGVGRTGSMAGAYAVGAGERTAAGAVAANLSVGPPSLEQIWYVASSGETLAPPPGPVVAVSRVLDAPRRLWSYVH
ncbi:MAG: Protein tyrosine/serine phosphatase [Frankiales bacterium]|jgi:protein tyrosine phosphatase (PTP) superfamily phosphohydrolase (DUF442 family)|nr:Protein tyrosine/serine phosphatase [Frankiales bacterium]